MTPARNNLKTIERLAPLKALSMLDEGVAIVAPQGLVNTRLKIHEVYASIQGESSYAGLPCVFVRTTACNLRCRYCDTAHAFIQGEERDVQQVFEDVRAYAIELVELTGGEPLLQPGSLVLMRNLADAGHKVLLETSGSLDISSVDPRITRIVDFKTPDSGEVHANLWSNVKALRTHDEVKFVLLSREDYEWARDIIAQHNLSTRCKVLMGVVFDRLPVKTLVDWVLEDGLQVRVQLQLHKYIWSAKTRGV